MKEPLLNIDQIVDDRYKVIRQLSGGSYSQTYVVQNLRVPIEQVLKINLKHEDFDRNDVSGSVYKFSKEFDHIQRTKNEIECLTNLNHPKIVRIIDLINLDDGYQGILTGMISNPQTLKQLIEQNTGNFYANLDLSDLYGIVNRDFHDSRIPDFSYDLVSIEDNMLIKYYETLGTFMKIFPQTLSIIDYLNKKEIIHKDIKPENILVDQDMNLTLIDFGLSSNFGSKSNIWGSDLYRASETFTKNKNLNFTDLWSMGLVLWELLNGDHLISSKRRDVKRITSKIAKGGKNYQNGNNFLKDMKIKVNDIFMKTHGLTNTGYKPNTYWETIYSRIFPEFTDNKSIFDAVLNKFDNYLFILSSFLVPESRTDYFTMKNGDGKPPLHVINYHDSWIFQEKK